MATLTPIPARAPGDKPAVATDVVLGGLGRLELGLDVLSVVREATDPEAC